METHEIHIKEKNWRYAYLKQITDINSIQGCCPENTHLRGNFYCPEGHKKKFIVLVAINKVIKEPFASICPEI